MPIPQSSPPETSRTRRLEELVHKLEDLTQSQEGVLHEPNEALAAFDGEVEQFLTELYGAGHERLQSYKYATLGEAEAIVNLPDRPSFRPSETISKNRFSKDDRYYKAAYWNSMRRNLQKWRH